MYLFFVNLNHHEIDKIEQFNKKEGFKKNRGIYSILVMWEQE